MDYTPGTEKLTARSVRLPEAAWTDIKERARIAQRRPLDWLRLQIMERLLVSNGSGNKRRR